MLSVLFASLEDKASPFKRRREWGWGHVHVFKLSFNIRVIVIFQYFLHYFNFKHFDQNFKVLYQ